jgi:putative effector of murein hydrolase LrgA (UPF0299 family)
VALFARGQERIECVDPTSYRLTAAMSLLVVPYVSAIITTPGVCFNILRRNTL